MSLGRVGTEVGLGHGHNVLDEDPARAQFSAHVCCGQTAGRIKMPLGMEAGISPGDLVLDGDPAPPNKGHSPHFSAHVCSRQMAGWIKMPFSTEVDHGSSHIVFDGNPAPPPPKGAQHPLFSAHVYCGQMVAHLSYC